jgi:hypothetical protein
MNHQILNRLSPALLVSAGIFLGLMAFSTAAIADQHSGVKTEHGKWIEAVKATGVFFNARYRYEHVEDKGFTRRANANTLQTHLGYKSNIHHGVSGLIELENAHAVGANDYNSTTNGRADLPTVADPENTELNQAYLSYHDLPGTVVSLGRQRLALDNQRYIGAVGFRQNEQTFDALTVINSSVPDLGLTYVYVKQVLRIFGDDNILGSLNSNSHVLHAVYSDLDIANIVGYAIFLMWMMMRQRSLQRAWVCVPAANMRWVIPSRCSIRPNMPTKPTMRAIPTAMA